ncbi:MAG TPA: hypothetical protein VFL93_06855 [Longimicrobiaceae bacterium]|nr:hypothetical protein [Longimicrobiaceae bacterium]
MATQKKKKKTRSAAKLHRQVQDSLQALPYIIEQNQKQGKRFRAVIVRYVSGPMLRVMNGVLNRTRYRGEAGAKQKQTDQMRRHLEHRQAAIKQMQSMVQKQQRQQRRGRPM